MVHYVYDGNTVNVLNFGFIKNKSCNRIQLNKSESHSVAANNKFCINEYFCFQLIHCACCCEPYHLYCVEGGMKDLKQLQSWWRVDWVCPRCTMCNTCGKGDGPHVSCHRCRKSYHMDCLPHDRISNRAHSSDRPWVSHKHNAYVFK